MRSSSSRQAAVARQQSAQQEAQFNTSITFQQQQWEEQKAMTEEQRNQERMMRIEALRQLTVDRERALALRDNMGFSKFNQNPGEQGVGYNQKFEWYDSAALAAASAVGEDPNLGYVVTDSGTHPAIAAARGEKFNNVKRSQFSGFRSSSYG